jgi:hypothetical protein
MTMTRLAQNEESEGQKTVSYLKAEHDAKAWHLTAKSFGKAPAGRLPESPEQTDASVLLATALETVDPVTGVTKSIQTGGMGTPRHAKWGGETGRTSVEFSSRINRFEDLVSHRQRSIEYRNQPGDGVTGLVGPGEYKPTMPWELSEEIKTTIKGQGLYGPASRDRPRPSAIFAPVASRRHRRREPLLEPGPGEYDVPSDGVPRPLSPISRPTSPFRSTGREVRRPRRAPPARPPGADTAHAAAEPDDRRAGPVTDAALRLAPRRAAPGWGHTRRRRLVGV